MVEFNPSTGAPALIATYRLQLTPNFGLKEAAEVVPYLAELGISHVYTSSYLQAAAGSTHGYDTTDHARVSTDLGGEDALADFQHALRGHGMGNVVDVVPNHMSVAAPIENRRWWNVLRDGPTGPDASFFDIDWHAPDADLAGKVLLPVLGDELAVEIASGAIVVVAVGGGGFEVRYADMRFPVAEGSVGDAPTDAAGVTEVLDRQHYRLAWWREGTHRLNYRRFFDVTTLACVRVEEPAVFDAVHRRTLQWLRDGDVQGLRIDHPDGLRDPTGYLRRLRQEAPGAWIVVEKILEPGEALPDSWPVDGTTGYDTMRMITALFVDPAGEATMTATFNRFVGETSSYKEQLIACKGLVADELFDTELSRLVRIAGDDGIADPDVRAAIRALLISMPVYRTYVAGGRASANDNSVLAASLEMARIIEPSIDPGTFDALSTALHEPGEFAARFEQLSGPVMAKGLEDTLFYRYDRLVALNEVGSDPSAFGMPIEAFHEAMASQSVQIPRTMVGTSTHDTKRSEDVRARIALISEMPDEWAAAVSRWSSMNQTAWNGAMPDPTMEYLLYQTMFGAYPLSRDRAKQFLQKAVREAKQRSSWLDPSEFEATLFDFADEIVDSPAFQDDLASFVARFAVAGRLACLAQVVLKVTLPGVPDFYQGSELWTDGLVDPDNRRPVDYVLRRHLLETIAADPAGQLDPAAADDAHGLLKLRMTKRLLQIRRTVPSCFVGAAYAPLVLNGAASDDAIGYTRGGNVAVVVPVRPLRISRAGWRDTTVVLPGQWVDALGGGALGDGRLVGGTTAIEDVAHHGCMVLVAQDAIR